MENTPVDKRIDEDGEVLDERVEERGDALVGEVKGNDDDDEMFEEAVDAQQLPQRDEEAKLNQSIGSIDLDVNGGASGDEIPDDGIPNAAYDEAENFEEALGTPTAAARSVDGGRSEDDIPTTAADEKEKVEEFGAEKEAEGEVVDDSMEKLQVVQPKIESFSEAIVAPNMASNVIDEGGTKEETEIPSNGDYNGHLETGSKEIEESGFLDEEARDEIVELDEKLQVSFEKADSFEEAISTPSVLANVADYDWSKEENSPDNTHESCKENDVKVMIDVDESTENLQVSFEKAESFEEAIGTPTVLASIAAEEWNKEENPPENGHGSHDDDDVKEVDGVDELTENLNVSFEKAESFEEAIGTPTILASIAAEEWNKAENAPDNGHEIHMEGDVKEIDGKDESTEELKVSFEKPESFEEAIGTPTVLANVVDKEWSKDEIPPSEGLKEVDLKETEEVGANKETRDGLDVLPDKTGVRDSEIKGVGADDGGINCVEEAIEATDKSEVVPDKGPDRDLEVAGDNHSNLAVEVGSRDLNAAENQKDGIKANVHVNGEVRGSESPDLAPRDADSAKELKDEEQKDVSSVSGTNHQDDSNGNVKTALSGTKTNDGEKSVEDVSAGTKSPEIDGSTNSGKAANEKIGHADRSINAAPVLRKKEDTTEKVNKVELPPLKQMNQAPARPAGLGRAAPLLEPATRGVAQQPRGGGSVSQAQPQQIEEAANTEAEEHDETREKLQMIRVKFLRLAHRLGQTPHNVVVAQVLYRLGLAEQLRGRNGGRVGAFSFDRASAMAEQLEASGQDPLDFSCTIMVLGKSGVGKSATINSIFDEPKLNTDAFSYGTKKVEDVVGTVQGIKVRVIDTPGLLPSGSDQRHNEKILHSVKRFIKKTPPDIILYLDRLDVQSIDLSDMPLLRTITDIFGASVWFNAIVVLTHAASAPPEGPNGVASSYDMFVTQRSHVVQQAIRQAAGDMRLMNPVSLVENHSACRTNRAGQRVLPNGQVWKPHLLLLSFASKILAEANALLKLQDSPPGRAFAARPRMPPLPYLLSSLLQPRAAPKLPQEQYGDEEAMDDDDDSSSDSEEESEYDELPPFKRLTKAQLSKLSGPQKKAYFEELEYREKLFMKKQMKEERRQRRMMKKMAAAAKDNPAADFPEEEEEAGGAASVPVPMPDLALPASFDSDNPTHRYRYLDTSNQWLVRPVLETHGWDHDIGYEGINVERLFTVKNKVPVSFSGQVTKDKKDANVQMEVASSIKHGEGKGTSVGFDMQTVGKELAYTLRSETKLSNHRRNKASAGLSMTLMNDAVTAGFKIEDKVILNKCLRMLVTAGAITARGDVAYGGSLDATWKDKDPLGRFQSTLGLSVMDWHGDLAIGGNVQSQIPLGRTTNLIARANLNNRGAGQVSFRVNSTEQLQIVLVALVPLLKKVFDYSPRQLQFGFGQ